MSAADRVRRVVDVAVAASGLVLLSPLLATVAVAVRVRLGAPVLFRQRRSGRDGRPFELLKFRSMRSPAPGREAPEFDHERIDGFGRLLRSASLDELPSLLNLLRGDITLVGPRPLPVQYLPRFTPDQRRRLEVKPGITGLAQVAGRNTVDWPERLALDVQYVDTRTLRLDLSLLLRTVPMVLRRTGVDHATGVTMKELQPQ
ncbi:MAG: sugar transferase [Actinomycetota bacterium]|nr:sugar transferase [Actinomycetota bacterium]